MPVITITVAAPAKINLTLDVTGRREDGYHTIVSVMQAISLFDRISVDTDGPGIRVCASDARLPDGPGNTAYRAAQVFFDVLGRPAGATIHIDKRIPLQAGLAGGSADAAGVLVALNRAAGEPFSLSALCSLGAAVGADVPFCLRGGTALAQGTGTDLTPLPALPDCLIVVAKPDVGISTADAYRRVDTVPITVHPDSAAMATFLRERRLRPAAAAIGNVFEEALDLKEVAALRAILVASGMLGGGMSGSGSAVFGLFDESEAASSCAARLEACGAAVFVCRPYAHGPTVVC